MAKSTVGVRDLRNNGGDILQRVQAGEHIVVTKSGKPVAELSPIRKKSLNRSELLARWRHLPKVDAGSLRSDLDDVLDAAL